MQELINLINFNEFRSNQSKVECKILLFDAFRNMTNFYFYDVLRKEFNPERPRV